jgi:hypothetical protein
MALDEKMKPETLIYIGAALSVVGALLSTYGGVWSARQQMAEQTSLITGGDSFCYLDYMYAVNSGRPPMFLAVTKGSYPLYDVKR